MSKDITAAVSELLDKYQALKALNREMLEGLKECRGELGLYEADASGEHYNNPSLNDLIERAEALSK